MSIWRSLGVSTNNHLLEVKCIVYSSCFHRYTCNYGRSSTKRSAAKNLSQTTSSSPLTLVLSGRLKLAKESSMPQVPATATHKLAYQRSAPLTLGYAHSVVPAALCSFPLTWIYLALSDLFRLVCFQRLSSPGPGTPNDWWDFSRIRLQKWCLGLRQWKL